MSINCSGPVHKRTILLWGKGTGRRVAFEERILHFKLPLLIHMANFRSPWYYNYHDDKHIGVNLSREYDKPVSIPFRAALFYAQPILAPRFSSCRWAASTRVPDDSDNPTLTEVPRPGAKTVLIEWYHLRCFQKRAFLREWRKERWDNMEPKKYFAPRETKS